MIAEVRQNCNVIDNEIYFLIICTKFTKDGENILHEILTMFPKFKNIKDMKSNISSKLYVLMIGTIKLY